MNRAVFLVLLIGTGSPCFPLSDNFLLPDNLTVPGKSDNRMGNPRSAVQKAIRLVEKSCAEYLEQRDCFSCHHQALPVIALSEAKRQRYQVSEKGLQTQVDHVLKHFKKNSQRYANGEGTGGQVDTAGYGLWALDAGGRKADASTRVVMDYLFQRDAKRDFYRRSSERPPSEASHFTTTFLALRAMEAFPDEKHQQTRSAKTEKIRDWVSKNEAKDTEDQVFRLLMLKQLEFESGVIRKAAERLRNCQNRDGGWSQKEPMKSDAYATATALYALLETEGISVAGSEYQKGCRFLLSTQKKDGSWHVKSRSSPFQEYFESGFPHKKDQFISITATCWAILVLSRSPSDEK